MDIPIGSKKPRFWGILRSFKDYVGNLVPSSKLDMTAKLYPFYKVSFFNEFSIRRIHEILVDFQKTVVENQKLGDDIHKQWSFSGAFLYSLTVITTIGKALVFIHLFRTITFLLRFQAMAISLHAPIGAK